MILTDREIRIAIQEKQVILEPLPDLAQAITSTAMDLTLGNYFKTWKHIGGISLSPGANDYSYADAAREFQNTETGPYKLKSHHFVLAWTAEKVTLPYTSRLAARVEGKSNLARLGVSVHVTAPIIHAGFTGQIQLEMFNIGPYEIVLDPGMWICQLVFEQTAGTPDKGYAGMFSGQSDH